MSVRTFSAPTRVVAGLGSLDRLDAELASLPGPTAVVADSGLADIGLLAELLGHVDESRIGTTALVDPDPDLAAVEAAADAARSAGCASVLAVGGGSGLGAAKAVSIQLTSPGPITAYEGTGRVPRLPAPTVAVPTTAGSGSEVSNALVLHEPGRDREIIVRGPGCEPCTAILDGTILRRLPRLPMLYAGLDALTHALESLWANGSTVFTESLAIRAAHEILATLPVAVAGAGSANADGDNDAALQRLLEASTAANLACGNSGLGLVHALSASVQVTLPHGLQNGVLLPRVAELNRSAVSPDAADLIDRLPALYEVLGFHPQFDSATVGERQIASMIAASTGHPFRINNRKDFTDDQLHELLTRSIGSGEELLP
ncbi:iron-containing alcohol dehydrogenase [Gordonia sp. TBRC 11910]|uniref:Iron-containing alcohol dehydrogenase n=1 Tax=Gordonia asplenii TaxID=2725283 RepID=A0A848KVE1_9ACTN|nr:iron-containing alcohol dehydrogenase [Gordonia asplenii]NMO02017.1 iron-containing alcohol dehydrogenase [Gordonia asplenii]